MTTSLIPKRLLSFPSLSLPNFWNEDEEWLTSPSTQSGLSIYEDDHKVYIEASVPGIDPKNVDVTFQDGYLWIQGETKEEEEDKKKRELVDVKNAADALIYTAQKAVKDAGEKVSPEDKKAVEEKLDALSKVKDGEDVEGIKVATEELSQAMQKIGQAMYQQNQEQGPPQEQKPEDNASDKKE